MSLPNIELRGLQQQGTGSPLTSSRGRGYPLPAAGGGVTPYQQQGTGSPLTSSRGRGHPLPAAGDGVTPYQQQGAGSPLTSSRGRGHPYQLQCGSKHSGHLVLFCISHDITKVYTATITTCIREEEGSITLTQRGREGGRDPSPSFYIPSSPHYVLRHLQLPFQYSGPSVIQGSNTVDP